MLDWSGTRSIGGWNRSSSPFRSSCLPHSTAGYKRGHEGITDQLNDQMAHQREEFKDPMPTRIFAIGDIPGCSTALKTLIEAIDPRPEETVVVLGVVIHSGPDSRDCVPPPGGPQIGEPGSRERPPGVAVKERIKPSASRVPSKQVC
jgi:hypothetical protein